MHNSGDGEDETKVAGNLRGFIFIFMHHEALTIVAQDIRPFRKLR
jgi:hypothetical protein